MKKKNYLNKELEKDYLLFIFPLPIMAVVFVLLGYNNVFNEKISENIFLIPLTYILIWAYYFSFIKK